MKFLRNHIRHNKRFHIKHFLITVVAVVLPLIAGTASEPTALERVLEKGHLTVISRNGPTTIYEGPYGLTGYDYNLVKGFADHLGVELKVKFEDNLGTIFEEVGSATGDVAAASLTITPERTEIVRFTSPYQEITEQVLYLSGTGKPKKPEDLIGKDILVIANSSHAEQMRKLKQEYPDLRWKESNTVEMLDLIEMVSEGKIDHALVDSISYEMNRNLYPNVLVGFEFDDTKNIAWAFPNNADNTLFHAAEDYFNEIRQNGFLTQIDDHYYGHLDELSNTGAKIFYRRMHKRLPKYKPYLQTAADMFELDWHWLAALSYQESHWNPKAKSPTGVRGFMMLTQGTAKDMGVTKRTDVLQSIYGGAKYFYRLRKRIPADIPEPDRTYFALAAYNVGFGHLKDAQYLTKQQGGNPNVWTHVKQRLPLLAKRKYYKKLKHGYARGWEPVNYVENIRHFHNILSWNTQLENRRIAAAKEDGEFLPPESGFTTYAGSMSTL